jgi:hypothetical protein
MLRQISVSTTDVQNALSGMWPDVLSGHCRHRLVTTGENLERSVAARGAKDHLAHCRAAAVSSHSRTLARIHRKALADRPCCAESDRVALGPNATL